MSKAGEIPTRIVEEMNKSFFEVGTDGILAYQDHSIGALQNLRKKVAVQANVRKTRFELHVDGVITETYDWSTGVTQACQDAFAGYFAAFEKICKARKAAA
ncbi:MAG: hypothetical protein AMXMBFR13_04490 [Phycisphaerae bacterium]